MSDFDIATFPVSRLLTIVADLLTSMCIANDRIPTAHLSVFDSRAVPPILITDYMTRILKYTPYSNQVLLCMLIYFDRIAEGKDNTITLHSHNIHRFIITAIVIATKSTSDIYYKNSRYAKVGGITVQELSHLEWAFLKLCDFRVHVPLDELQQYANQIWQLALSKQQQQQNKNIPPTTTNTNNVVSASSLMSSTTPVHVQFPAISSHSTASSMSLPLTPPYDGTNTANNTLVTETPSSAQPFLSPTEKQHQSRSLPAMATFTFKAPLAKKRSHLRQHPYSHIAISK